MVEESWRRQISVGCAQLAITMLRGELVQFSVQCAISKSANNAIRMPGAPCPVGGVTNSQPSVCPQDADEALEFALLVDDVRRLVSSIATIAMLPG